MVGDRFRRSAGGLPRDRPGELTHVDVKKLGRISDGGGWRVRGRGNGTSRGGGELGYDKLHIAVGDHSRLAFVQVHADQKGTTCASFLADAIAWFAEQSITVKRVMTDNAKNYTLSQDFQKVMSSRNIKHIERCNRLIRGRPVARP